MLSSISEWLGDYIGHLLLVISLISILIFGVAALYENSEKAQKEIVVTKSESELILILEGRDKELMLKNFEENYADEYEFAGIGRGNNGTYLFIFSQVGGWGLTSEGSLSTWVFFSLMVFSITYLFSLFSNLYTKVSGFPFSSSFRSCSLL